jgi:hypothetical protein
MHSDNIPNVRTDTYNMSDLFHYFGMNWDTLSPALYVLYGVLFAFFLLAILKRFYNGE